MNLRRLATGTIVAALVAFAGAAVDAQFGNPLKKVPRAPSVPAVSAPAPSRAPARKGVVITDDLIERYLKAMKVQKEVLAKEMAEVDAAKARAQAQKAKVDALQSRRAESQVNGLMKTAECKDAFKEKDPRSKEVARLEDQVAAADSDGNEAKSEALRKKLDPLSAALDVDADRACGGRGTAALHDCLETKKAALAKQGVAEPMLTVQAQGECMGDPTTSGFGGSAPSAEEEAAQREEEVANKEASEKMEHARMNADKAAMESAGLTGAQWGVIDHCVRNRINGGPGCDEDSNIIIDRHREQLKTAVSE